MLRHLGETTAAERVEQAVREVIADGRILPRDLGGQAGTKQFAAAIADRVAAVLATP